MKKLKPILVSLGVLSLALLLAVPFVSVEAHAQMIPMSPVDTSQKTGTERITGDWPAKGRQVTLKRTDGTVAEALETICKQLDLGLVLDAPPENTGKAITVRLAQKPARDVLAFILESGDLQAELKNGILFVRAVPSEPVAVPAVVATKDVDEAPTKLRAPLCKKLNATFEEGIPISGKSANSGRNGTGAELTRALKQADATTKEAPVDKGNEPDAFTKDKPEAPPTIFSLLSKLR